MYRMTLISEEVRIGRTSTGDFNIEVRSSIMDEDGEREPSSEIFIPGQDAEEIAKYILRRT